MIKLHTHFEKNKLNISNKEELFLIELEGISKMKKNIDRKKLNISLCIDVSGSMSCTLDGGFHGFNPRAMNLNDLIGNNAGQQVQERPVSKTKLQLVKEASINALSTMEDGDIISIVAFDDKTHLVKEATEITKENRKDIIEAINSLVTRGSTNIHGGWLRSVEEVAKNVNKKNLNRVIMLTDGQANSGKRNPDEICTDVSKVSEQNVSTSTFGVGADFNETLLSSMSDSGSGNFYFINEDGNFDVLFNEEFTGLSNICATGITVNVKFEDSLIKEVLSEVVKKKNKYTIQDLTTTSNSPLLLKLNTKDLSMGEHNLGSVVVKYKDIDGRPQKLSQDIIVEVVSEDEWNLLDENEEVKVQELLVIVAKNKQKAKTHFEQGNLDAARGILEDSSDLLSCSSFSDERLDSQSTLLGQTIVNSETQSADVLSKTMHYEAYRSFKGK